MRALLKIRDKGISLRSNLPPLVITLISWNERKNKRYDDGATTYHEQGIGALEPIDRVRSI